MKNCLSLLRMTDMWIWYGWDLVSNIFLAAWIESVMTMTLEMFSSLQAWLMPHLIAKSSTSVLVTKATWWTVLTRGWSYMWICEIEVVISFLMLTLETTIAVWGVEAWIVMSSNCWERIEAFFPLLAKLKENLSGKISIILEPGIYSGLRGEKDGKTPYSLLLESMMWPFIEVFWRTVRELIEWGWELRCVLRGSSMRFLMR